MDLNFDSEMALLTEKRRELVGRLASIDQALAALNGAAPAAPKRSHKVVKVDGVAADTAVVRAGRKPMSPKARKAAKERMLKYWAGQRAKAAAEAKAAKPKAAKSAR